MRKMIQGFVIIVLLAFMLAGCEGFDMGNFDFGNIKDRLEDQLGKDAPEIPIDLSTPPEGYVKTFEEGTVGNYMVFFSGSGSVSDALAAFQAWITGLGATPTSDDLSFMSYAPGYIPFVVEGFNGHIVLYTQGEDGNVTVVILVVNYDVIDKIEIPDFDIEGYESDLVPRFEGSIRIEFYTAYESESSHRYSINNRYIIASSVDVVLAYYEAFLIQDGWVLSDQTESGLTATKGENQIIISLGQSQSYEGFIELFVTVWYPDFWDPNQS
jgi:hypothetical protein